jgi:hypothetical protein
MSGERVGVEGKKRHGDGRGIWEDDRDAKKRGDEAMRTSLFSITFEFIVSLCFATKINAAQNTEMMRIAAYLAGIAKTHYCACQQWPASWEKLKEFDDNIHAYSRAQQQKAVQRLPWEELSQSRLDVAENGNLKLTIRLGANALPIEVPESKDCGTLNTKVFESMCTRP